MGIIQRQSIKNSIVSFAGVLIAVVSTLYIYKLDEEIYGFAHFIYSTAYFLTPFAAFGLPSSVIKYFPDFQDKKQAFLNSMLLIALLSNFIFCLLFLLFQGPIYSLFESVGFENHSLIQTYLWVILPLCFILNINFLLVNHASNMLRIVVPELISNLGYKVALPCIILASYFGYFEFHGIAISILVFYIVAGVLMFAYLKTLDTVDFTKGLIKNTNSSFKAEFFNYSVFSGLNTIGGSMAFRIDIIMISIMVSLEAAGIYGILIFLASVIEIPLRAIARIASPIISKAWQDNNLFELDMIYRKSSINLLLVGILIFVAIWFALPFLDRISVGEDRFVPFQYVFLFLAIGKLLNMVSSVNGQIIIYSKDYKYHLVFLLILGVLNVVLNVYLIQRYDIFGAALASCIAYAFFNLIKFLFIYLRYNISPFSINTFILLALSTVIFWLVYNLPLHSNPLISAPLKVIIFSILYIPIIIKLKISVDLIQIFSRFFK